MSAVWLIQNPLQCSHSSILGDDLLFKEWNIPTRPSYSRNGIYHMSFLFKECNTPTHVLLIQGLQYGPLLEYDFTLGIWGCDMSLSMTTPLTSIVSSSFPPTFPSTILRWHWLILKKTPGVINMVRYSLLCRAKQSFRIQVQSRPT